MRTKGLVVIAVPIAILFIVLGSTSSRFTHVDNRAQDVASHSRQIVDAATTLENSLLSAETGLSGYLLTGNTSFQSSYARAEKALPPQLGQLEALTFDTPKEQIAGRAIKHDTDQLVAALAPSRCSSRRRHRPRRSTRCCNRSRSRPTRCAPTSLRSRAVRTPSS